MTNSGVVVNVGESWVDWKTCGQQMLEKKSNSKRCSLSKSK